MSVILNHQAATRAVFRDGREGVLLLSSMRYYRGLIAEAEQSFARKSGPDFMMWLVNEPIILDPPRLLLQDLRARGSSDQIYEADLAYLADYELHWGKPVALYVGRWDGAVVRGSLDGVEFVSDSLSVSGQLQAAS